MKRKEATSKEFPWFIYRELQQRKYEKINVGSKGLAVNPEEYNFI